MTTFAELQLAEAVKALERIASFVNGDALSVVTARSAVEAYQRALRANAAAAATANEVKAPSAGPAPASVAKPGLDLADAAFNAAWLCPHSIDAESVTLYFDSSKPGHNALNQLHMRIDAAINGAARDA